MHSLRTSPSLLLLAACAPSNAVLTEGSYIAFVDDRTSLSIAKDLLKPNSYNKDNQQHFWNMDCQVLDDNAENEDVLRIGCTEDEANDGLCDPSIDPAPIEICTTRDVNNGRWPPLHEEWATQSAFRVVTESLEPWRGEALITSEGDLQIAFHHRTPTGSDTRFVIAIDPDFLPTTCQQTPDGFKLVEYDGDWIEHWSRGTEENPQGLAYLESLPDGNPYRAAFAHFEEYIPDGRLYLLNQGGYQINPSDLDDYWSVPDFWQAGTAQGKFIEDTITTRGPRYGEPFVYNFVDLIGTTYATGLGFTEAELWYCFVARATDADQNQCMIDLDGHIRNVATEIQDELGKMMSPTGEPADKQFDFAPMTHTNFWRPHDGRAAGFDGWGELHYNAIVFSADSDLSVGGRAEGAFSLVLDATESSTRVYMKGKFEIEKIKRDRWVTDELEEQKLIENDTWLCDAASKHDANPALYPDPAKQ